jgi:D-arginine dehydrogenase
MRLLAAASRAFYEARAGGLALHPVLRPRGELLIARADQLGLLDALERETGPQVPGLERLDAAAVLARVPVLDPTYVAAGLHDPGAMDLDVAAVHQGYLLAFRARGGRVVTDAEVLAITTEAPPWRVETRAGGFEAPVIVDAAGAWADEIAAMAGVAPLGLVPKRRTAFVFEPSTSTDPEWPMVCDAEEGFYFKPESGLLLGSPADETPMPPCDVQPEELDVAIAIDRIERAGRFRVLRVMRKWAGLRTFAPDDTLVVGMEETVPGFFWLAGQGGYGIQTAPAASRAAARLLVEGVLPDDLLALGLVAEDLLPLRLRSGRSPAGLL